MAFTQNPATLAAGGVPVVNQAAGKIDTENSLDALRAQYLSEIFALPQSTAVTIAELAFPEAPHA